MSGGKGARRVARKIRIRRKISGTAERPRLSIYRSLNHLHAQLVDDLAGRTLLGISTQSKDFKDAKNAGNAKGAAALGKIVAKQVLAKKIKRVVFDRGGFLYHGRVKAFADAAREGGLEF